MFKKIFLIMTMAMFSMVILNGCGGDKDASMAGNKKKIVVGTNATFVPFEFKNEQTKDYDGYDIEMIKAIAKQMEAEIEFQNVAFDALIPALNSKHIDIAVSGMTITDARKEKVLFSMPYYESGLAIVTKANHSDIKDYKNLQGKQVAVQVGSTGADFAHKIEGAIIREFDHSNEAILEMKIDGAQAAVLDLPVAQYYAATHKEDQVIVIPITTDKKEYFGMAMNINNKELQNSVNNAIIELKKSGEFNRIYKKWFKEDSPVDMPMN